MYGDGRNWLVSPYAQIKGDSPDFARWWEMEPDSQYLVRDLAALGRSRDLESFRDPDGRRRNSDDTEPFSGCVPGRSISPGTQELVWRQRGRGRLHPSAMEASGAHIRMNRTGRHRRDMVVIAGGGQNVQHMPYPGDAYTRPLSQLSHENRRMPGLRKSEWQNVLRVGRALRRVKPDRREHPLDLVPPNNVQNWETVDRLESRLRRAKGEWPFPPMLYSNNLFPGSDEFHLVDGSHRQWAASNSGVADVPLVEASSLSFRRDNPTKRHYQVRALRDWNSLTARPDDSRIRRDARGSWYDAGRLVEDNSDIYVQLMDNARKGGLLRKSNWLQFMQFRRAGLMKSSFPITRRQKKQRVRQMWAHVGQHNFENYHMKLGPDQTRQQALKFPNGLQPACICTSGKNRSWRFIG